MVGWPRTMVGWDPWLELRRLERDLSAVRGVSAQFPQLRATSDDAEKVKASAKDGVLEIELPRAAADSPRRITVQAG